jgi:hypothetical protein
MWAPRIRKKGYGSLGPWRVLRHLVHGDLRIVIVRVRLVDPLTMGALHLRMTAARFIICALGSFCLQSL